MIKTYTKDNISPIQFYREHIEKNRPCVIKNFYNENDKCYKYYIENINNVKEYKIGYAPVYSIKSRCLNNFMKEINKLTTIIDDTRMWKHNKGNTTPFHYDGNGQNVINICLSGSKRFYLAPPSSIPVYPLSNIAIHYNNWDSDYIDIEKGDLLYIPSYWFHKVVTLKNNTITVNHLFFHKNNNLYASHRDLYLYTIHSYLNSSMCDNNICNLTKKKPLFYCLLFGIYEISWIYFILFIIFLTLYKHNLQMYRILNIISFISMLYLYKDKYLDIVSCGISKLFSLYLFIFLILLNISIRFILPKCRHNKILNII
jgi:dTDP-4-dehydrorhamnose 3,5-epimerase-like enzyme